MSATQSEINAEFSTLHTSNEVTKDVEMTRTQEESEKSNASDFEESVFEVRGRYPQHRD